MPLEVITCEPEVRARSAPLIFVHGAFAGAWVWLPHFLPYFARHGYRACALSLRGHGGSDGDEGLMFAGLRHYVADVEEVAGRFGGQAPVLIGHSMGGLIVQQYMSRHPVAAAVLMSSAPPHGLLGSYINMIFRNPEVLTQLTLLQTCGPGAVDLGVIRRALFSDDTSDGAITRYLPMFGPESMMVVLDMFGLNLPPSTTWDTPPPTLVLGAERDPLVYPGAIRETARTYRAESEIFAGMGHAMMLDHHWQQVADRIRGWLDETLAATRQAPRRAAA